MKEIRITKGEESVLKLYEVKENDKWSIEMSPDGLAKLNGDFTIIPTNVWQMKLDAYEGMESLLDESRKSIGMLLLELYQLRDIYKPNSDTYKRLDEICLQGEKTVQSIASEALNKEV